MEYVLGIDIGTGSAKAVAVDLNSEPIASFQYHYPTNSPEPGFSEQDPELVWQAVKNCIFDTVEKLKCSPLGICFSSAMHSVICMDEKGNCLTAMITWADCRSDVIAARLKNSAEGMHIYRISGMPLHAMSPLCKILWLKENSPALFSRTHKFISIKEFIWYKLFRVYEVDYSIAGASGMLDISSRSWSQDILRLAGIEENQLSQPVRTTHSRSGVRALGNRIGNETVFFIGSSDGCLANLGSFALGKGVAAITIGTSGAVRIASPKPIFNSKAMTFSYYLDEGTFICGGPVNNGGNVLQWLTHEFLGIAGDKASFDDVFKIAEQVPAGSQGLLFLPYINGERAPVWDAKSSGAFVGIRSVHSRAHFCRAVLEGVCFALNEILQVVENGSRNITQINVSGGFVNSETWMKLLADITGKRVALLQTEDASALGAAFMAIKGLGLNGGKYPETNRNSAAAIIEPDSEKHRLYHESFLVFKTLYSGLKDSMHKLNFINH